MRHSNTGLSFLSGAMLGAAAMYILDPEAGDRRRHAIAAKAGEAYRGTGDRLSDVWSQAQSLGAELISHAQDLGAQVADRARASAADTASQVNGMADQAANSRDQAYHQLKGLQDRVANLGQDLLGRARLAAGKARETIDQAQQSARESTHPLRHKIARTIDPDHDHPVSHATAYASAGVGAVALGAAAMYFFDPEKGTERRDYAVNQLSRCVQETGHVCRLAGQYVTRLWNRRPSSSDRRSQAGNPIVGEQLVQRVRNEIAPLLSNPAQVQLMADANGVVTLYGRVPASELDQVLTAINKVLGVSAVLDRLDAPTQAESDAARSRVESTPQS